jgi:Flp pilus assembly pilin Flp
MQSKLKLLRHLRGRRGQTLVEYSLILALIIILSVLVLIQFGGTLKGFYSTINSQVAASVGS